VLESGKPFVQAAANGSSQPDLFEWFAEEGKRAYGRVIHPGQLETADRTQTTDRRRRDHRGVEFSRYNIARAGPPARGRLHVVIRPSEYTPLTAMEMMNLLVEADTPTASRI